jgi:nitrate/TMAO reductase-like tetraheme cytochrome c subunit
MKPFLPALLLALAALPAAADGVRVPDHPVYSAECGNCHVAYPPQLLSAPAWRQLMAGLDKHFGSDASLDPATVQQVSGWLAANAGSWKRVAAAPPQDRITRSEWFIRKHREIAPTTWRLPAVKSPANCAACHGGAEQGDFDEDRVRIPR